MQAKIEGSLISYMSNLVKSDGGINCAQGIPGFDPPEELLRELSIVAAQNCHQYAPGYGIFDLRNIIAQKIDGRNITAENILITNGATEAISLIYLYIKNRCGRYITALGFDPVYESYSNLPRIHGDRFINFQTDQNGEYDFNDLENIVKHEKVKVVFLASPGNPYGKIMDNDTIEKIINICHDTDCYLIFDAVYSDIYFDRSPYLPIPESDRNIFFVSAFSKMLSITGWRVGYLAAHNDHIKKLGDIHDYTGLSSPSVLQKTLFQYLSKKEYGKGYLENLRFKIKKSFDLMHKNLVDAGFFIPEINGGYFIWAKLPEKYNNGFNFAIDLYKTKKVAIVPGIHFSENYSNWVRINIARSADEIVEASERIKEFI